MGRLLGEMAFTHPSLVRISSWSSSAGDVKVVQGPPGPRGPAGPAGKDGTAASGEIAGNLDGGSPESDFSTIPDADGGAV
jgi:hypothetical protein